MNEPRKLSSPLDDELKAVLAPSDKLSDSLAWIQSNYKTVLTGILILLLIFFGWWRNNQRQLGQMQQLNEWKHAWMEDASERSKLLDPIDQLLKKHPDWMGSWKGTFLETALSLDRPDLIEKWRDQPSSRLFKDERLASAFDGASSICIALSQVAATPSQATSSQATSSQATSSQVTESQASALRALLPQIDSWLSQYAPKEGEDSPALELCRFQLLSQKALIHAKLGELELEKKSWNALLAALKIDPAKIQLAGNSDKLPSYYTAWLQTYGEGRINLLDYISYRLKLKASS